jgi:trimeric autotransporter adhesin
VTLLLDQTATIPNVQTPGFFEYSISNGNNGPTITAGDWYIGFQAPTPNNGVVFWADTSGPQQQRAFFSANNGQSYSGPLAFSNPTTPANVMIRAVVTNGGGTTQCSYTLSPTSQQLGANGGNVSGNNLYVGGNFRSAGGTAANSIARWNGTSWSALTSGVTTGTGAAERTGVVNAIAVDGQDVYVGGTFEFAGGVLTNSVAKWNGTSWSALGAGTGRFNSYATVTTLATSGGSVYLGGDFERVGNSLPRQIARWDGTNWTPLGSGASNGVDAEVLVIVPTGRGGVYVGGRFTETFGDKRPNRIAEWNGTEFLAFGKGVNTITLNTVHAVAVAANGDVFVGGQFTHVGGKPARNVARWDGNDWHALGAGVDGIVYALVTNGDEIFIGGAFSRAGGLSANNVARWNRATQAWATLGSGADGIVSALLWDQGTLYAGGFFTGAGGVTADKLARWNGTSWSAFGAAAPSFSNGIGTGNVNALAVVGNLVFIGGDFLSILYKGNSVSVNGILAWDRARDEFARLGTATDFGVRRGANSGTVNALAAGPDGLYVGGRFNRAGSIVVSGIARYNAGGWSALAGGVGSTFLDPEVRALALLGSDLYVGGYFDSADAANARLIARWNTAGNTWSALGSGLFLPNNQGRAKALATSGNAVYVGGYFITAGSHPSASFARWGPGSQQQQNPVPTLSSLSPNSATAGSAALTLTVNGTNFINGSVVRWNGQNRTTTFVSATRLTAQITAADLSSAGAVPIIVFNPAPGGGVSNALNFTINPADTGATIALTPGTAQTGAIVAPPQGQNVFSPTQYTIQVPAGTTQLKIDLSGNQDLDLFVRYGSPVAMQNNRLLADQQSDGATGDEQISVTALSLPALRSGTTTSPWPITAPARPISR